MNTRTKILGGNKKLNQENIQEYERKRREFRAVEMGGIVERNMHPAVAAERYIAGRIAGEKDGSTHVKKKKIPGGCVLLLTDNSFIAIA